MNSSLRPGRLPSTWQCLAALLLAMVAVGSLYALVVQRANSEQAQARSMSTSYVVNLAEVSLDLSALESTQREAIAHADRDWDAQLATHRLALGRDLDQTEAAAPSAAQKQQVRMLRQQIGAFEDASDAQIARAADRAVSAKAGVVLPAATAPHALEGREYGYPQTLAVLVGQADTLSAQPVENAFDRVALIVLTCGLVALAAAGAVLVLRRAREVGPTERPAQEAIVATEQHSLGAHPVPALAALLPQPAEPLAAATGALSAGATTEATAVAALAAVADHVRENSPAPTQMLPAAAGARRSVPVAERENLAAVFATITGDELRTEVPAADTPTASVAAVAQVALAASGEAGTTSAPTRAAIADVLGWVNQYQELTVAAVAETAAAGGHGSRTGQAMTAETCLAENVASIADALGGTRSGHASRAAESPLARLSA